MALLAAPGQPGSLVSVQDRYGNFIGGEFVPPVERPVLREPHAGHRPAVHRDRPVAPPRTSSARSTPRTAPSAAWGRTSAAERADILNKIADRIEANLEMLAVAETWENGKPVRETLAADLPLAVDHFRYFAGAIRAQEGSISEIDADTVAYHFHEPLGVVGQIIPWNFPILMATWKLAPALAAGNCVDPQARRADPVVDPQGHRARSPTCCRRAWSTSSTASASRRASRWPRPARIAKIAFTGETTTGRLIMQYASQNLIPVTLELGGKSPNIFFDDVAAEQRRLLRQGARGLHHVRPQPGRGLHLPVPRAGPGSPSTTQFMPDAVARTKAVKQGNPLDTDTMIGAQASNDQLEKILSYLDIGKDEGAKVLTGGERAELGGELAGGYYVKPTIFEGNNSMRIFQEEIFGPVRRADHASTTTTTPLKIANDTLYGLGAGVWTRDGSHAPTGRAARSRPAGSGPTATTSTRRTRLSAATSSPASAARTTR